MEAKATPLESLLFSNGVNSYCTGDFARIPHSIHNVLSLSGVTDEIEVG
jgi:hypothetical protein